MNPELIRELDAAIAWFTVAFIIAVAVASAFLLVLVLMGEES